MDIGCTYLRKTLLIGILFFSRIIVFGQVDSELELIEFDSLLHKEIYRIEVAEFQRLELIELKSGKFEGTLTHAIWKTNRREKQKKRVVQKIKLSEKMIERLMVELKNSGYETLKDCSEIRNCIKGLDGTTITFYVIKNGTNQSASYWELESDYYYETNSVELPNEVLEARKILMIINSEIDLKKQFRSFTSQLPVGKYLFNGIVMELKRKW